VNANCVFVKNMHFPLKLRITTF